MKRSLAPLAALALALGSLAAASHAPGEVDLGRAEFRTAGDELAHLQKGKACSASTTGKVVSAALLADELLLELLPLTRIGGVSYVVDSEGSTPDRGRYPASVPRNNGGAEEVLLLRPDAVVISDYTSGAAEAQLGSAGLCVMRLRAPGTFDDLFNQVSELGEATSSVGRAMELVRRGRARLAALKALPPLNRRLQVLLVQDPYAYGPGTLQADCLRYAGLDNVLAGDDFGKTPTLGVEQLLSLEPDVVIFATNTGTPGPLRADAWPPGAGWSRLRNRAGVRAFEVPSPWMASISHHALDACEAYARLARGEP